MHSTYKHWKINDMEKLRKALEAMKIEYTEQQIEQYAGYMEETLSWNEKVNLTNITDREEFEIKHFIDSIICVAYDEFISAESIIDVGTGGGFPGVPLAIIAPDKKFTLMDSLNKRLKIIDENCLKLGIRNVKTVHARAEELARNKQHREQYDLCISRAVANMATLAEYCLPFIKKGGCLMAYKGPEAPEEAKAAAKAIKILGGEIEEIRDGNLSEFGIDHKVIVIRKVKETPAKYPRKAGTPSREPIR